MASKASLTRAINSGDPHKVIEVTSKAFEKFNASGYPDNWSDWHRAESDAIFTLQRNGENVDALWQIHNMR